MLMNVAIVAIAVALAAYLEFSRRLAASSDWKATVTPLASIMGSGFLISAPLLAGVVGNAAIFFMAALLVLAYLVGSAIRFNIRHFEPIENKSGLAQEVAFVSRLVLAGAYLISVSYYLQLLAAFVLHGLGSQSQMLANGITSALLLLIAGFGVWGGLGGLERVTRFAVSLNLGVIVALLLALMAYNLRAFWSGHWALPSIQVPISLQHLQVVLGLLIVVQGFETSRYLGDEHPAPQRIKTMRAAQLISAAIYLVFIGLATILFRTDLGADVTAIITMTKPVATVLPLLLGIAAVGSQLSAAVADSSGAGGLFEEISQRRISIRSAYVLLLVVTLALTWETNVNQIIAYASRAFALYYACQALVAWIVAWQSLDLPRRHGRLALFTLVTLACLAVFFFGIPAG